MSNDKIKILYATSECTPFAHSGGLGEVAGSLPRALNAGRKVPIDCRVVMPLYGSISKEYRNRMKFLGSTTVPVTWRNQYAGLFELRIGGVTYYFVDNEYYFDRVGLYGHYDDGERFAFFSRAVFELIPLMNDFVPDIMHANDWQTALIPVYQQTVYKREYMRTVFSVHNVEYQGHFGPTANEDFIGIPDIDSYILEFGSDHDVNLMKAAIETCNIFSTVSPTYAEELKDPANAFGLDGIVRRNSHKLRGIINGINTRAYDPENDNFIDSHFSATDLSGKSSCKASLQEYAGLPVDQAVPVMTMISRLVPAKGIDLVRDVMDRILDENDVQFIMLGTGDAAYEEYFRELEKRHPEKVRCMIEFSNAVSHKIYAGGDMILVPSRSEPCGLTQMIGCRYGTIPVVRATGGLADTITDCTLGDGNGFVFQGYDADSLYNTIMNALAVYGRSADWKKLVMHAMRCDFSWRASAEQYRNMYIQQIQ